jgi:hypothetical protein
MGNLLTYTSNEDWCVTKQRAYIGYSKMSGTLFTIQGLCDRVLCIGCDRDWMSLKPNRDKLIFNCDSVGQSHVSPDIVLNELKWPCTCCPECLIQAAELLAVCVREKCKN